MNQNTKNLKLIKSYISELSNEEFKIFSDWFIACLKERLTKTQNFIEVKQNLQQSLTKFEKLDAKEKTVDAEIQAHTQKLKANADPFADFL